MKLTDKVWARVVQCVQEGMLMGIDVVDVLRQIDVTPTYDGTDTLTLSPEYEKQVEEMHEKLLKRADDLRAEGDKSKEDQLWQFTTSGRDDRGN